MRAIHSGGAPLARPGEGGVFSKENKKSPSRRTESLFWWLFARVCVCACVCVRARCFGMWLPFPLHTTGLFDGVWS